MIWFLSLFSPVFIIQSSAGADMNIKMEVVRWESMRRRNRVFRRSSNMILPEDCVSEILSLTSPMDALRTSLVCSCFRSAADSDLVWERFLPPDYEEIMRRSTVPRKTTSKKQLFFTLCNPILLDGGRKSFKLERQSGKKWYLFSARELSITWGNNPLYWKWVSTSESRFSEAAVLRASDWLEIRCKIRTRMLTPNTMYGAFIVFKKTGRATYGLDLLPAETTVEVRNQTWRSAADLSGEKGEMKRPMERGDGWTELEVGEFFTGEDDAEVRLSLTEVKGCHLKGGLVVEGMEFRPKGEA